MYMQTLQNFLYFDNEEAAGVYLRFRYSVGISEQILFLSEWVVC